MRNTKSTPIERRRVRNATGLTHTGRALGFEQRKDWAIGRLAGEVELRESDGGEVGSNGRSEERKLWKRRMERKKGGGVCCCGRHGSRIGESEMEQSYEPIGSLVVHVGISASKGRGKKGKRN